MACTYFRVLFLACDGRRRGDPNDGWWLPVVDLAWRACNHRQGTSLVFINLSPEGVVRYLRNAPSGRDWVFMVTCRIAERHGYNLQRTQLSRFEHETFYSLICDCLCSTCLRSRGDSVKNSPVGTLWPIAYCA